MIHRYRQQRRHDLQQKAAPGVGGLFSDGDAWTGCRESLRILSRPNWPVDIAKVASGVHLHMLTCGVYHRMPLSKPSTRAQVGVEMPQGAMHPDPRARVPFGRLGS